MCLRDEHNILQARVVLTRLAEKKVKEDGVCDIRP